MLWILLLLLLFRGQATMAAEILSSTMTKTDTSDSSSSNSPPQTQKPTICSKAQRQHGPGPSSSSRYRGVVPQQNGHWGAQIYANHQRIWLGTFKTEEAAASAYNSAALKLRSPNTVNKFEPEIAFQALYTVDQVLNMIKNGSYPTKFGEFLASKSMAQVGCSQTSPHDKSKHDGYLCQELFRKELTPSDVGKLNRLVIPKRYALEYFPKIDANLEEREGEGEGEGEEGDMELTFYDNSMRKWNFRYCYWKSSQSFVFTRGWNKFVREKALKANDIVAFRLCEWRQNNASVSEEVKKIFMIDTLPSQKGLRLFGVQIC
ncbi:hypothetical protein Cgig2_021900 [Carnegiea gigantea]|uniref:Uncharacterized protein n=1 Tax=Carnegiea gigantea TaxID=171969 RepID=A0A9Q1JI61_9CARY|nr:hypothetical protein Cgig2_021900 [Carnegiea gigantea]